MSTEAHTPDDEDRKDEERDSAPRRPNAADDDEQLGRALDQLRTAIAEVNQAFIEIQPRVRRMNAALAAVTAGITDRAQLDRRLSLVGALMPRDDSSLFLLALMQGSGDGAETRAAAPQQTTGASS